MNKESDNNNNEKTEQQQQLPPLVITSQYVKDLSFEAPGLPGILFEVKDMPNLELNIDIKADSLKDNNFEVTLKIKVQAKTKDNEKVLFICELAYAALAIVNVPKEHLELVLSVEVPRMLFPFARQIIADITKESGFSPVVLAPIDFFAIFKQRAEAIANEEAKKAKIN